MNDQPVIALQVRVGTTDDVHDVMDLALASTAENAFLPYSTEKLLREIYSALSMERGIMGLIGVPGGKPEGAILLRIGEVWYSSKAVLQEQAVFIHPDYRSAKGGRARRLCEFAKMTAERLGMPLLIGIVSNERTEAKVRLYQRQFGTPAGAFFLYGAHTGGQVKED